MRFTGLLVLLTFTLSASALSGDDVVPEALLEDPVSIPLSARPSTEHAAASISKKTKAAPKPTVVGAAATLVATAPSIESPTNAPASKNFADTKIGKELTKEEGIKTPAKVIKAVTKEAAEIRVFRKGLDIKISDMIAEGCACSGKDDPVTGKGGKCDKLSYNKGWCFVTSDCPHKTPSMRVATGVSAKTGDRSEFAWWSSEPCKTRVPTAKGTTKENIPAKGDSRDERHTMDGHYYLGKGRRRSGNGFGKIHAGLNKATWAKLTPEEKKVQEAQLLKSHPGLKEAWGTKNDLQKGDAIQDLHKALHEVDHHETKSEARKNLRKVQESSAKENGAKIVEKAAKEKQAKILAENTAKAKAREEESKERAKKAAEKAAAIAAEKAVKAAAAAAAAERASKEYAQKHARDGQCCCFTFGSCFGVDSCSGCYQGNEYVGLGSCGSSRRCSGRL